MQTLARKLGGIEDLCKCENEQLILVFSHQQFIQAIKWLLERGRDERAYDLQSREMSHFHKLLNTYPIPNGAILKTRLNSTTQQVLSGFETSHIVSRTASVVSYMEANSLENCPSKSLPLPAGC